MNKRIIIGAAILLIFIFGGVLAMRDSQDSPTETVVTHSNKEIIEAIIHDRPVFLANDKPVIEVVSAKKLEEKWFAVTIKSIHEKKTPVPVKVVLIDQGEPNHALKVILGPDIFHSEAQMANLNLPDAVILELLKS